MLVAMAFVVVVLGVFWAYQRDGGEGERFRPSPGSQATETMGGHRGVTGTSGRDTSRAADDDSDPSAVVPPAIIQELDTITGSVGGQQLIGRRVDLHVTVQDPNDVSFWAGEGDNRVLVVMSRDNRDGATRQVGKPPTHAVQALRAGEQATVSGSIQRLPNAEEMFSWQLTRSEAAEALDRQFYIRADTVAPNGHGTH